jgi:hypothetical protein
MNTCFFCGRQPADPAHVIQQPVYRLDRYAHLGFVRRFEFSKMTVPVERCAECSRRSRKARSRRKKAVIIGAVAGFFIGLVIPGAFLFTAIIGGYLGYVAASRREKKSLKSMGLKGLDLTSLSTHPVLGDKLNSGWRLKKL